MMMSECELLHKSAFTCEKKSGSSDKYLSFHSDNLTD